MNDPNQAAIAEGNAVDIRRKIFERRLPIANGFAMNHPIQAPDGGWYFCEERRLLQDVLKTGAEQFGKGFDGQKKIGACGKPTQTICRQASARNEIVDVWMIDQIACPGMKDTDHPNLPAHIARVLCQFLCGFGRGLEQNMIEQPLVLARKIPQLRRERKGQQEVGRGQ